VGASAGRPAKSPLSQPMPDGDRDVAP
jgi:hypothetical protein